MRSIRKAALAATTCILIGLLAGPAAASEWGPRVGVADDPDQVLVGLQWDLGSVANRLYVQPDAELGMGNHATVLLFSVPLHYRFRTSSSIAPYAGGGVSAGLVWPDGGDTNFEMQLKIVGGLQWRLGSGNRFFTELSLGLGDLHDVTVVGGWMLW